MADRTIIRVVLKIVQDDGFILKKVIYPSKNFNSLESVLGALAEFEQSVKGTLDISKIPKSKSKT